MSAPSSCGETCNERRCVQIKQPNNAHKNTFI
jgi:hypothetical protein